MSFKSLGALALVLCACSANNAGSGTKERPGGTGSGGTGTIVPGTGGTDVSAGGTVSVNIPDAGSSGGTGGVESCATQKAESTIVRQPVDIILVIDNSGSMQDECNAVEVSINQNFASVLQASGVDYRVILISRHEKGGTRQQSLCILSPLSSTDVCPPVPDVPAFSERFFQYSTYDGIQSLDSLRLVIDMYDATVPDEFGLAPEGWSAWLRPDAKKVFLEITDDDSTEMSADEFENSLFALSAEHFGSAANRKYTFHSIIGIGEKPVPTEPWLPEEDIQNSMCTGNSNTVEKPGVVYQDLSKRSGGLRFPLCQFLAYDVVFETIANNVVSHSGISCDFAIPPPPAGRDLDLSKVAVSYDPGDGSGVRTFGQAMNAAECQADAFYIDSATQQILLCPTACEAVQAGLMPVIDVLFTCEPTYIPPPQ
jgi:hypothetical protein